MRIQEAKRIIYTGMRPRGYRVHFERIDGSILCADYFPGRDEPLIEHEEEAWEIAVKFAHATRGLNVNVYVVDDRWAPVLGYRDRMIENREAKKKEE